MWVKGLGIILGAHHLISWRKKKIHPPNELHRIWTQNLHHGRLPLWLSSVTLITNLCVIFISLLSTTSSRQRDPRDPGSHLRGRLSTVQGARGAGHRSWSRARALVQADEPPEVLPVHYRVSQIHFKISIQNVSPSMFERKFPFIW